MAKAAKVGNDFAQLDVAPEYQLAANMSDSKALGANDAVAGLP